MYGSAVAADTRDTDQAHVQRFGSPQGYIGQSFGVIFPLERSLSDDQEG